MHRPSVVGFVAQWFQYAQRDQGIDQLVGSAVRDVQAALDLSHGESKFLPYAADRFPYAAAFNPGITHDEILADLRRFYFDTALSSSPTALPSLLAFADPTHLTFGSDFPFVPDPDHWTNLLDSADLGAHTLHAINRGNAEALSHA